MTTIGTILQIPGRETDMPTMKILTEDAFINTYGPEANDDSSFYRWREWCTPEEREELADHAEARKAWTYVDTDHGGALYNGVHIVNRLGYVFTQIPYEEGEEIMVPFDNPYADDAEGNLDEAEQEPSITDTEDSEGSTAQALPDGEKR